MSPRKPPLHISHLASIFAAISVAALLLVSCSSNNDSATPLPPPTEDTTLPTSSTTTTTVPAPSFVIPSDNGAPTTSALATTAQSPTDTTADPSATTAEIEEDFYFNVSTYGTPAQIVAGRSHTCVLFSIGFVTCWGDNSKGQLGNETVGGFLSAPENNIVVSDALSIAAGPDRTCAVHISGEVSCWGDNEFGKLGIGESSGTYSSPVKIPGIDDAIQVALGHNHSCVAFLSGGVSCWGSNEQGQLGATEVGASSAVPVSVPNTLGVLAVVAGAEHTCAINSSQDAPIFDVLCWGSGWSGDPAGQTAGNPAGDPTVPTLVEGITNAIWIASSDNHTCALQLEGDLQFEGPVVCWGANNFGQLGNGATSEFSSPTEVSGLDGPSDISVGSGFTCAISQSSQVYCWGNNDSGQLGSITEEAFSASPVAISNLNSADGIAAGTSHACALQNAKVYCWGSNSNGQLGAGEEFTDESSTENSATPVLALGF